MARLLPAVRRSVATLQFAVSLVLYLGLELASWVASLVKLPVAYQRRAFRDVLWRPYARRYETAKVADLLWWAVSFSRLDNSSLQPAPLPWHIIDADSAEGQELSETAVALDRHVLDAAEAQQHPAWCWRATSVTVLNAFHSSRGTAGGQAADRGRYTQSDVLKVFDYVDLPAAFYESYGVPYLDSIHLPFRRLNRRFLETLSFGGMPLRSLVELLRCYNMEVELKIAYPENEGEFRADVNRCLQTIGMPLEERLVVCFGRPAMDMMGVGHFAPVVGISGDGSKLLLVDSNSWRYAARQWVDYSRLWNACCTKTGYGTPRGYFMMRQQT